MSVGRPGSAGTAVHASFSSRSPGRDIGPLKLPREPPTARGGRLGDGWLVQLEARDEGGREADDSEEGRFDGLEDTDDVISGVLEVRRSLGLTAVHRSEPRRKVMLTASASSERYSPEVQDSPIARRAFEYEIGISLVYHF